MVIREDHIKEDVWDVVSGLITSEGIATTVYPEFPDDEPSYPMIVVTIPGNTQRRITYNRGKYMADLDFLISVYSEGNLETAQLSDSIIYALKNSYSTLNSEGIRNINIGSSPIVTTTIKSTKIHVCNIGVVGGVLL